MPAAPKPPNEAARLETLRRYDILDSLPDQQFDDATTLAAYICGTPIALISLVDYKRQWFKSVVGLNATETARNESFCAHTLVDSKTLIVHDAMQDARFADNPLVLGDPHIRFYAGAPLIAPNGHVLGTLCVIDDKPRTLEPGQIGALEALARQVMSLFEASLRERDNRLKNAALIQSEKLAAVGRMASSIAHEINNPLEAVTNLIYLARTRAVSPEVKDWLTQADNELRRVSAITSHTLRFHRQSSRPEAVSCLSLFTATLTLYNSRLVNSNIAVEKRKRANEPIECFQGDIRQVLSNLFANAIDAMPGGGRLILRSREATDWSTGRKGVTLTIADNGTGMSEETQQRAFEAFYSTKGIGGSGLGLWISEDIVSRHHGRIKLRSSQRPHPSGTVISIFIPFGLQGKIEAGKVEADKISDLAASAAVE